MYEQTGFPLLSLFVFAPTLGALAVLLIPSRRSDIIKTVAAAAAAVPMVLGGYVLLAYRDTGAFQYYEVAKWIDGLNVCYRLGIDGISAPLIVLSGVVGFVAVVASWGIEKQIKGYFALILLLLTGMNGVFVSLDFFLFYVFWELMLLPMYFLIGVWGGPRRVYAAIKFFLYTMAGSVLMLVVLLVTWYWSDGRYAEARIARLGEIVAQQAGTEAEAQARAERLVLAGRLNRIKERIVERRVAAWRDLQGQGALEQITRARKRAVLVRHGIAWVEQPEKLLDAARRTSERLAHLPPTLGGSKEALEGWKAQLLSGVQLERTFNLLELKARYELFQGRFRLFRFLRPLPFAALMFLFLYLAFAIKVPIFPFHTWLPWAHVEAPTAISVILAGILLKMGVYGFLRISYSIFPTAAVAFAVPIAVFAVINIIYGALCAMAQDDMKKLVAYSSVSHMGFCMLGMASLTLWGMTGSILQMFNHGTSTSMMFLLVGVIYDRAHHRDINRFGGLAKPLPVYAGVMTLALFASMGLPGLSGFISEIMVFLGSFGSDMGRHSHFLHYSFQSMTIIAALGVILTAAYLLWMMQRVFFGPLNEKYLDFPDLTGREIFTLAPLGVLVILFGVYPQPLINLTQTSAGQLQQFVIHSTGIASAEKRAVAESGRVPKPDGKLLARKPAARRRTAKRPVPAPKHAAAHGAAVPALRLEANTAPRLPAALPSGEGVHPIREGFEKKGTEAERENSPPPSLAKPNATPETAWEAGHAHGF